MNGSLNSVSDVRITSLITTSITHMVRQEVGKIMQELNMPVCNEAIDRIIAENLDKEVEKQNFVKTYKRKFKQLNQYKCIEKRADPDEVVITSLLSIENRIKKLEDFVWQNLMQRPQLMQDLAVRSRENLAMKREQKQKQQQQQQQQTTKGVPVEMKNQFEEQHSIERPIRKTEDTNNLLTNKPTYLNLDDVIKVIKECPETQNSFDIFQSAAECIKRDLERFIQDHKSDVSIRARNERGREELETKNIACKKSLEKKDIKLEKVSKNMKVIKALISPKDDDYIESAESVTLAKTTFKGCKDPQNFDYELGNTDSDDTICAEVPPTPFDDKTEQQIIRPTVEEIAKAVTVAATNFQIKQKSQCQKVEVKSIIGGDAVSVAQHVRMTSMACGDKRAGDPNELKSLPPQGIKNSKAYKTTEKDCAKCNECKGCTERMQSMRDRAKPYAIDEDIKWKLDKILDHIGDFCSRTGYGKETQSEPDRKTLSMKPAQPGTSAELMKRPLTRTCSVKPKHLQQIMVHATALNGKNDRKNLDKIIDQIRHTQLRPKVLVTNVMSKATPSDQAARLKANKPPEQPRKSVEAFKTKWSMEYSKNLLTRTPANTTEQQAKSTLKPSQPPPRNNIESMPKAPLKKRPVERTVPLTAVPLLQQQNAQKSSTTLMLESIDQLARSAAAKKARVARVGSHAQQEIGWVYSRRPLMQAQTVNLSEVRRTKVLYHNYKF